MKLSRVENSSQNVASEAASSRAVDRKPAKKTSRAIVVDEGYERYGVTAEIASVIADGAFYYLDAPVRRMGAMDVPVPFSPVLEDLTVPSEQSVFEAARAVCRKA